ncbi:MAG: ADP-forming succinate--CoA ligase subunit beta, partial [Pseudomonadota bacterium]
RSGEEARRATRELGGESWVVKAQVHAGGRGKGGGVVVAHSEQEVVAAVERLLGNRLVTPQTGGGGLPVEAVLVEQASRIERELYLGMLVDRQAQRLLFMGSAAGGMNIEEVAQQTPERILTLHLDPAAGLQPYQCRRMAFALGLRGDQVKQLSAVMHGLARLFQRSDASLVEINPLILTDAGELLALDAKVNLDDSALFRHPQLAALRDRGQEDEREAQASEHGLNYISLEGNIGCMVNGAGLAMATMDLVKLQGGTPANFLDVGGGTTAERVAEAFKLILSDDKVRAVLVNIFGGIVRCDLIAEGIIEAVKEVGTPVPVVVRLEGTNAEIGRAMLDASGLALVTATDLTEAAAKAVAAAKSTA